MGGCHGQQGRARSLSRVQAFCSLVNLPWPGEEGKPFVAQALVALLTDGEEQWAQKEVSAACFIP